MYDVSIRKFKKEDILLKIEWVNNPQNNKFLHYDLPLEYDKTLAWFENIKERTDRYDAVIQVDGVPVGLIGLLSIDNDKKTAEYYISMGNVEYKGKGIAYSASKRLLEYAFTVLRLNEVYLYTEKDNLIAQKLFERVGFCKKELLLNNLSYNGRIVDRFYYCLTKDDYLSRVFITPIHEINGILDNRVFIKREDLIPYSFGGNKARKAKLFFDEIEMGDYNCVVTYGSSHSNHCRIVSNMAAQRGFLCYIITPLEVSDVTFNSRLMNMFGAKMIAVPVEQVHETIEKTLNKLKEDGNKPYFIPGGGHGNIGTRAYVNCYDEISFFEKVNNIHFDYIFFASGTGTTHAGLVCGQILNNDNRKIVGISIARKNPRGRDVVVQSVKDYFSAYAFDFSQADVEDKIVFLDEYVQGGYGKDCLQIQDMIKSAFVSYGVPLDSTYTAKAFYGMVDYIKNNRLTNSNILFIHTGGTPLFFDDLRRMI